MESFSQVFGVVAAICAGIIILALFFSGFNFVKRRMRGFEIVKSSDFIKDGRLVNIHLTNDKQFTGLRFVGFTDQNSMKLGVPHGLSQMIICENAEGSRLFFRAEEVRMIEEVKPHRMGTP